MSALKSAPASAKLRPALSSMQFLAPFYAQIVFVDAASGGSVSHFLGVLATTLRRYEQAESHFSEALALYAGDTRGALPSARLQLEWAEESRWLAVTMGTSITE